MHQNALVLFSGGQDSTTCLAWALERYEVVETVGFKYGQRHSVEMECRKTVLTSIRAEYPLWDTKLGADHVIDLAVISDLSETSLTRDVEIKFNSDGLPNTFVPGRNIMFLTTAAMVAYRRGATVLIAGMCETDFSGYPDCRDDTIKALQVALNIGMASRIVIETPLMWIDKAGTWVLARNLGGEALVELIKKDTHTCYKGDRSLLHDWGYGCSKCPACELRSYGYIKFLEYNP